MERRPLFLGDRDRVRFLDLLGRMVPDFGVRCYLYCLMRNHGHLLVETPRGNLSKFMHRLETAYSVYFNLRHHRVGHLLQGRFGAKPVQGDTYLLKLSRYVHLNPVWVPPWQDASLEVRRDRLRDYPWSSYREYVGLAAPTGFLDTAPLLALVSRGESETARCFARFVDEGLVTPDDETLDLLHASRWGIGDIAFQERVASEALERQRQAKCVEDVAIRRTQGTCSVDQVLRLVAAEFGLPVEALQRARRGCPARAVASRLLCAQAGLSQRGAAKALGIGTGAAVSLRLKELAALRVADATLDRRIRSLEAQLKLNT